MKKYILKLLIFLCFNCLNVPLYSSGNSYLIRGNKYYEEYCKTRQEGNETYEKFKARRKKILKRAEEYYLKSYKVSPRETIPKLLELYGKEDNVYKFEFLKYIDELISFDKGNEYENHIEAIEWCLKYLYMSVHTSVPYVIIEVDSQLNDSQLHDKEIQNELLKRVDIDGIKNFNCLYHERALLLLNEVVKIKVKPKVYELYGKAYSNFGGKYRYSTRYYKNGKTQVLFEILPDKEKSKYYYDAAEELTIELAEGEDKASLIRKKAERLYADNIDDGVIQYKRIKDLGLANETDLDRINNAEQYKKRRIEEKQRKEFLNKYYFEIRNYYYPRINGCKVKVRQLEARDPCFIYGNPYGFNSDVYYSLISLFYGNLYDHNFESDILCWVSDFAYLAQLNFLMNYSTIIYVEFDNAKSVRPYKDPEHIFYHYEGVVSYKGDDDYLHVVPKFRAVYPENYK